MEYWSFGNKIRTVCLFHYSTTPSLRILKCIYHQQKSKVWTLIRNYQYVGMNLLGDLVSIGNFIKVGVTNMSQSPPYTLRA